MNQTTKTILAGAGVLGLVAVAICIYKDHKKSKEQSLIVIDSEEEIEEETKEEKKQAISDKISSTAREIGKTIGTAALKFGAKHPKITKFMLKFGRYIPFVVVGCVTFVTSFFAGAFIKEHAMSTSDAPNMADDGIEFTRTIGFERCDNERPTKGWDEKYRENFDAVKAFADTLHLFEGEMFIIEDQKQYIDTDTFSKLDDTHPIVSHLIYNDGVYPPEKV